MAIDRDLCKELLAETKALLYEGPEFDGLDAALFGDQQRARVWELETSFQAPMCLAFLDRFTSAGNTTQITADTPIHSVVDPVASGQTCEGTWRGAVHRQLRRGGKTFVVQILRLGYATTLTASEARLAAHRIIPFLGVQELSQEWVNLDPACVDDLVATLKTTATATDPQASGNTLTGTFAVASVQPGLAEDGSGRIVKELKELRAPATAAALAALAPLRTDDYKVLEAYGWKPGSAIAYAYTWTHLNPASRATIEGISDATLIAAVLADATVLGRKWENQADNTSRYTLAFEVPAWAGRWTDKQTIAQENPGGYGEGVSQLAMGLTKTNALTDYATIDTPDADHVLVSKRIRELDGGQYALEAAASKVYTYYADATLAEPTEIKEFAKLANQKASKLCTWKRCAPANITAAYGAVKTYGVTGNWIHSWAHKVRHPDGAADLHALVIDWGDSAAISGDDWENFTDYFTYKVPEWRRSKDAVSGLYVNQVRFFAYRVDVKQTTSRTAAYAFARAVQDSKHAIDSKVEILSGGRYRTIVLTGSAGAWAAYADADTFTDLGDET